MSFSNDLSELPTAYIRNVRITQPSCQIPGEIRMEIFSSGNGPMKLLLFHPGGNANYTIPKGNLNISTYAPIAPGEYSIAIYDESAGLDCIHEIMVTMEAPSSFEIILEGVIPPSSPSASDGTALIVASVPGALPYVVLLNNLHYSTAFDHFIEVGGLGAGSYMIQLRDANNCLSNKLTVVIPPRLYSWSLGFQTNMDPKRAIQTETPGYYRIKSLWRSGFQFCLNNSLSGIPSESLLYFSTDGHQNYLDLEQLFTFKKFNHNNIHTYLQGGFGFHYSPELKLQSKVLAQIRSDFPISTQSKIFGIIKFQNMKEQRILFQFGINFINPFNFSKWKIFKSI
ncbi:MAG: hypothetical protein IPM92_02810 [Saprospiraceae bacterium]|nr:hypothetical protein [Saprospiraceae bacterium]